MSERKAGKRHLRAAVLDVSSDAEGHDAEAVASLGHKSSPILRVFTLLEWTNLLQIQVCKITKKNRSLVWKSKKKRRSSKTNTRYDFFKLHRENFFFEFTYVIERKTKKKTKKKTLMGNGHHAFPKKKETFFFMFMGFSAEETLLAHSVGKDVTIIWDPPKTCSFPKKKVIHVDRKRRREGIPFFLNVTIFFLCVCVRVLFVVVFCSFFSSVYSKTTFLNHLKKKTAAKRRKRKRTETWVDHFWNGQTRLNCSLPFWIIILCSCFSFFLL